MMVTDVSGADDDCGGSVAVAAEDDGVCVADDYGGSGTAVVYEGGGGC